jgi:uncharacterized DUF497 family protein
MISCVDNQKAGPYFRLVKFEWDRSKEAGNLLKHGVDFSSVPDAFGDPRRIFIRYPGMTAQETRWQLVGFDG